MCFIAFPPSPPILSLFCPQPDLLLFFSTFHSLSPLYCMLLLTLHFHPGSVILLSSSLLFSTHLLHQPCISFTAEAAPIKLILLLCCGASSTHRLGFPLNQSLWACVFLSFTLLLWLFSLVLLSLLYEILSYNSPIPSWPIFLSLKSKANEHRCGPENYKGSLCL